MFVLVALAWVVLILFGVMVVVCDCCICLLYLITFGYYWFVLGFGFNGTVYYLVDKGGYLLVMIPCFIVCRVEWLTLLVAVCITLVVYFVCIKWFAYLFGIVGLIDLLDLCGLAAVCLFYDCLFVAWLICVLICLFASFAAGCVGVWVVGLLFCICFWFVVVFCCFVCFWYAWILWLG